MRKFIALFSILTFVLGFGGLSYAINDEGATGANEKREIPGAPGFVPYKEIQLVRYGAIEPNQTYLSAGDVVVRNTVSDDGVTIALVNEITVSTDAVAGVVVSTKIHTCEFVGATPGVDYGRRNWGWIQVKGYCPTVNIASGPPMAGGAIYASTTARYATKSAAVYNQTNRPLGFAYDASSQGQAKAEIDL
jgi:hypothetical protein